ncbi:MAG: hypothetical protein IJY70_04075 [Clostridia bacterium]|nr:hypothetical protein [Clostridia bacterium]
MDIVERFFNEKTRVGRGEIANFSTHFSSISPQGSLALVISDGKGENYETVGDAISRFYRITPLNNTDFTSETARKIKIESEVKLIISVGGQSAVGLGKFLAHKYGLKHIFIALSPVSVEYLTRYCTLCCRDGYPEVYSVLSPDLILCDDDLLMGGDELADGYGRICARLVALFDADIRYATCAERRDDAYAEILGTIRDLIKEKEITPSKVFRYGLVVSGALADMDWTGDASLQFSHAITMLKTRQEEKVEGVDKSDGLLANKILAVYESALTAPIKNCVYAPNNNHAITALTTLLGVNPFRARKIVSPFSSKTELDEKLYCLSLYRDELLNRLKIYRKTLVFTAEKQKRLYKDKGFSYNNYADRDSVRAVLPLLPEMRGKLTLFSLLKQTGYLRSYP